MAICLKFKRYKKSTLKSCEKVATEIAAQLFIFEEPGSWIRNNNKKKNTKK